MYWHAELTFELRVKARAGVWLRTHRHTLRGYWTPGPDDRHDQFAAVVQVQIDDADRSAFLSGMLRVDGRDLGRADYRALARVLLHEFGVVTGLADRGGEEPEVFDVARWAA